MSNMRMESHIVYIEVDGKEQEEPQLFIKLKSENEDKSLFNDCGVSRKKKNKIEKKISSAVFHSH